MSQDAASLSHTPVKRCSSPCCIRTIYQLLCCSKGWNEVTLALSGSVSDPSTDSYPGQSILPLRDTTVIFPIIALGFCQLPAVSSAKPLSPKSNVSKN